MSSSDALMNAMALSGRRRARVTGYLLMVAAALLLGIGTFLFVMMGMGFATDPKQRDRFREERRAARRASYSACLIGLAFAAWGFWDFRSARNMSNIGKARMVASMMGQRGLW